jgi:hypothetical protein
MMESAGFQADFVELFPVHLDGDEWVTRSQTPAPNVTVLRALFREASKATRHAFSIVDEPWGFSIPILLMKGTKGG